MKFTVIIGHDYVTRSGQRSTLVTFCAPDAVQKLASYGIVRMEHDEKPETLTCAKLAGREPAMIRLARIYQARSIPFSVR